MVVNLVVSYIRIEVEESSTKNNAKYIIASLQTDFFLKGTDGYRNELNSSNFF